MKVYMAVTTDKYELPLVVEDTARALALKLNIKENAVSSYISKGLSGAKIGYKLIRIEI